MSEIRLSDLCGRKKPQPQPHNLKIALYLGLVDTVLCGYTRAALAMSISNSSRASGGPSSHSTSQVRYIYRIPKSTVDCTILTSVSRSPCSAQNAVLVVSSEPSTRGLRES